MSVKYKVIITIFIIASRLSYKSKSMAFTIVHYISQTSLDTFFLKKMPIIRQSVVCTMITDYVCLTLFVLLICVFCV